MNQMFDRRRFLIGTGLAGIALAAPAIVRAANRRLTIVSNPGLENATLNALMDRQGYFQQFDVEAEIIELPGATGPFDAILAGQGDVCMVSGYNLVLARIAQGAPVRIIGAGMRKVALALYTRTPDIRGLADLPGRTIAVGPELGLLHMLTAELLKQHGLDPARVTFLDKGSNDQAYQAVVRGEADACCSSISHLHDADDLTLLDGGKLWEGLPRYTFQTAYAAQSALRDKPEVLTAALAAYGALYDYLMSPAARDAFFDARRQAQKTFDAASALAVWEFNQNERPYTRDLTIGDDGIDDLQQVLIGAGALEDRQPVAAVADMSCARAAARLFSTAR
ncbi:ABC transporter substrate-binding protein [Sinirhodobacter populi]|uniref:ABC transporter substrate-binding protein n=1 Tax=Paenirhodobacter populi TaxID=2306993 RepID=A0A443K8F1_9RHOB|nr:ABC transporter substrate-binding protein [Sinirhodobacter populi]RWR29061.1 ABC transporter substrate-binding protein [Sinirhodobacter populi]